MIIKIFKQSAAIKRHLDAPLLQERIKYLKYWDDNGASSTILRRVADYLLVIINSLDLVKNKFITASQIKKASDKWASRQYYHSVKKTIYSKYSAACFTEYSHQFLNMLGRLKCPLKTSEPFENQLDQYLNYMRDDKGFSERTIKERSYQLRDFLKNLNKKIRLLRDIHAVDIDNILIKKSNIDRYSRVTLQKYASTLRSFFLFSEGNGLCNVNLYKSINLPRIYTHETVPCSPSWDDVKKLLSTTTGSHHTNIRDRAILMLLSVYGLRCSEVIKLRLDDIDWKNSILHLMRAKNSKPQQFPLTQSVGNAIIRYLKKVRPSRCELREIFICRNAPYRHLSKGAIWNIINRRWKTLNLKHYGPHSLRHACATRLINHGVSLKEISDHLGHQTLDATRIYTKVDIKNLRKVSNINIGDLL